MSRMRQKYWSYIQFARLDKPLGIWLVFFPTLWSLIWVSHDYHTFFHYIGWLFLGAVCARSAGCMINDGWDKDLDAHVRRTAKRPLADGRISKAEFILLLGVFGSLALGVLVQFNWKTIIWGLAVIPLIVLYPLMKRWTYWPQLFLAVTFNWGALVASTAVLGHVCLGSFLIYVSCACWTMAYDTIYAHQDMADDLRIGIKSTALRFAKDAKFYVMGFMVLFFSILIVLFAHRPYGLLIGFALLAILAFALRSLVVWVPHAVESSRLLFIAQGRMGWAISFVLCLVIILPLLWPR